MRHLHLAAITTLLFVGAVVACSSTPAAITSTDAGTDDGTSNGTDTTPTPVVTTDASVTTGQPTIYAHSATTLYRFDPTTNALTTVASFSGCTADTNDSVTDLAIASDGTAVVSSYTQLSQVNLTTAVCTPIVSNLSGVNSLAYVPNAAGIQQLVTYVNSTYYRVDPTNGNLTPLGSLGVNGYKSSGDIASLDGGTYLSVVGRECEDCLFQVDPLTGGATQSLGDLGVDWVYGLASSASAIYGFSGRGLVVRAVPGDGGMTTAIVFDAGTPSFYGAATGPAQ